MLIDEIRGPKELKQLNDEQLKQLAGEIRAFIIEKTSQTGGHLASNLGVIELTIGLYLALDLPKDKIIWDVGHQSYTHKILSGRKDNFDGLRQFGGMSGFPKRSESPYDSFDTGHSSTSISAGVGMAIGRDVLGQNYAVVSVIGDGALTGGMAFEALNNAARLKKNYIIVLNDNNMSIAENVGGISRYLNEIRTSDGYNELKDNVADALEKIPRLGKPMIEKIRKTKNSIKQLLIPGMLFENMGITYLGPVNGHDIRAVERAIRKARQLDHAVLVHVITKKGKGYLPAEKYPSRFHGVEPFDIKTGKSLKEKTGKNYTDVFSETMLELGRKNSNLVGITAAMPDGTGLSAFSRQYPARFFDVGIAEAHAVTSAAGMALSGLKPVVAVYSSFLQRAYDQIVHDVCLQKLPVVFAVDRAGLVGSDGETHQGIFDLSFLSSIPNMVVMAPKNANELKEMLNFAVNYEGPIAVRYPRGVAYQGYSDIQQKIELGKSERLVEGQRIALFALGSMVSTAAHIREKMLPYGEHPTIVNARFAKPVDESMLDVLCQTHEVIVTLEENVERGGMGLMVTAYVHRNYPTVKVMNVCLPDDYVEHGNVSILREALNIDSSSIIGRMLQEGILSQEKNSSKTGEK